MQKKFLLTIRGKPIDRVSSIKLLGVIFNEHLTWKDHMEMLLSKLKSSLYCVMRVKPYLNKESLLTLFHSLILSHIRYCITTWCFGNNALQNKLQKICNKFIKMISISKSIKNSKKTKITNIMYNIQQLYKLNIAIFMHKFFNKQLPTAFNNVFQTKTSNVITRSNLHYVTTTELPTFPTSTREKVSYNGNAGKTILHYVTTIELPAFLTATREKLFYTTTELPAYRYGCLALPGKRS